MEPRAGPYVSLAVLGTVPSEAIGPPESSPPAGLAVSTMRTLLSQFCEEFEAVVRPLLEPLKQASATLSQADGLSVQEVLPDLRDLHHQLQVVADKVGDQQAYVLIFGPLKSGKSTLMNAMCAAYVSEVTSLPAYPCMVYVSHASNRELVVTRYDGEQKTYGDLDGLRSVLATAHTRLASEIRRVEARDEEFDAQTHFPEAIRRIDVRLPAGNLAQSGAVLVDTPGLYTRMKFGYDRMTREFRDTAACAIFVVKSENLFLEQVFEEFNQLLQLFSRIFLLVNLDTAKMDLHADGSLGPSLERKDPVRIIEAFENLAMSAPLKAAADEGRLRIYPVDLLQAASKRLRSEGQPAEAHAEEDGQAHGYSGQADFDAFLGDLTDYLNSTDYLVAFLSDSLRHASGLLTDIRGLSDRRGVLELGSEIERLGASLRRAEHRGRILSRLSAFSWDDAFEELRGEASTSTRGATRKIRDRTADLLSMEIRAWFESDASLTSLYDDDLAPVLGDFERDLLHTMRDSIASRVHAGSAGLHLPSQTAEDLEAVGMDLDAVGRRALEEVDGLTDSIAEELVLDVDAIPVRKGFWDWILFRSRAQVRRRLLGAPGRPNVDIPAAVKARRLGDEARQALDSKCIEHVDQRYPALLLKAKDEFFAPYAEHARASLGAELQAKVDENAAYRQDIQRQLDRVEQIRTELEQLNDRVDRALASMEELTGRYGETEPELLVRPFEAEEATDPPAPALSSDHGAPHGNGNGNGGVELEDRGELVPMEPPVFAPRVTVESDDAGAVIAEASTESDTDASKENDPA